VPSITNIVGVMDKPHLFVWSGKKAAEEAVEIARRWPERLTKEPAKAVEYLKRSAERYRDMAAERGSRIHDACETLARGGVCPPLNESEMRYVDSWKAWLDRWQPEFLALECTVFGQVAGARCVLPYGGTGDLIFRANGMVIVADYKTNQAGLHAEVSMQLSAIAHAEVMTLDNETLTPMIEIDAAVAIHLSEDGYQVKPAEIDGQVYDTFAGLREAWDFHVLDGGLRDGSSALGRAMRGPEDLVPRSGARLLRLAA
jgi:hypothetical protein